MPPDIRREFEGAGITISDIPVDWIYHKDLHHPDDDYNENFAYVQKVMKANEKHKNCWDKLKLKVHCLEVIDNQVHKVLDLESKLFYNKTNEILEY